MKTTLRNGVTKDAVIQSSEATKGNGSGVVLEAALHLFAKHGYHATSIRSIATESRLSVPGVYHYYESKQAILDALVNRAIDSMLEGTRAADQTSDGTALGRFNSVVGYLLRFHMLRQEDAFVASTEMRSMDSAVLRRHIEKRDAQQQMITEIIEQGLVEGKAKCAHIHEASRAVASLCVSVSGWYHRDGKLPAEEMVARYLEIARRIAGFKPNCPRESVRNVGRNRVGASFCVKR